MDTSVLAQYRRGDPVRLDELGIPASARLLVLGPHPDDFDAIGVSLRRFFAAGNPLHASVLRTGSGVEDGYSTPPTLEAMAALRDEEQRASIRFFGLPQARFRLLDLKRDTTDQPVDSPENEALLRRHFGEVPPDIVFIPHGNDTNTGHRAVYSLVRRIGRQTGFPRAALLNRDPKTIRMRIDAYTPYGEDDAQWKAELLRFHDSQQQRNLNTRGHGFDERILAEDRATARELRLAEPYAEAFEIEVFGG